MVGYKLSREAKADIDQIYLYGFEIFGEAQADKYHRALYAQFLLIANQPEAYPVSGKDKYRKCVFGVNTIYYYIAEAGRVLIMRVLGRQDHRRQFE